MNQIDEFINYLAVERGYAPQTVYSYHKDLICFSRWLRGRPTDQQTVRGYIYYLKLKRGNTAYSINTRLNHIRGFARYFKIPLDIPPLKVIHRYPTILSVNEVIKLMSATPHYESPRVALMYSLIVKLLCCTGIRMGECVSLNKSSFDLENGLMRIEGKGQKERIIPLPSVILGPLSAYFRSYPDGDDIAWYSRQHQRICASAILKDIHRRSELAGITKRTYAHLLRHTFASHLVIQENANLTKVSKILGHSRPDVTYNYYLGVLPVDLKQTMAQVPWASSI